MEDNIVEITDEKLQRQVQITKPDIQITLVSDCPYEDMDYLVEKANDLVKEHKR
jgi:precorrin-6B methylase 2